MIIPVEVSSQRTELCAERQTHVDGRATVETIGEKYINCVASALKWRQRGRDGTWGLDTTIIDCESAIDKHEPVIIGAQFNSDRPLRGQRKSTLPVGAPIERVVAGLAIWKESGESKRQCVVLLLLKQNPVWTRGAPPEDLAARVHVCDRRRVRRTKRRDNRQAIRPQRRLDETLCRASLGTAAGIRMGIWNFEVTSGQGDIDIGHACRYAIE